MEESTVETTQTESQPAEGTQVESTQVGTEGAKGQSAESTATEATQTTGSQKPEESHVFDPREFETLTKDLPPELQKQAQALRKSLQGAYTKKFQDIASKRQMIEAYESFSKDPVTNIKQMAERLGYKVVSPTETQSKVDSPDWEPNSWDEVMAKAEERAEQRIMQKLSPVFDELKNVKRTSIENQLSEIDPSWQTYEDTMMTNLQKHPSLAQEPAMLYRMSVPQEVLESRATQRALAKLEAKVEGGKVSGGSQTNKQPKTGMPDGPVSFAEAVKIAEAKLAEEGIRKI